MLFPWSYQLYFFILSHSDHYWMLYHNTTVFLILLLLTYFLWSVIEALISLKSIYCKLFIKVINPYGNLPIFFCLPLNFLKFIKKQELKKFLHSQIYQYIWWFLHFYAWIFSLFRCSAYFIAVIISSIF